MEKYRGLLDWRNDNRLGYDGRWIKKTKTIRVLLKRDFVMLSIALLKDHPEHLQRLSEIWNELIGEIWTPGTSMEAIQQRFAGHMNEESLPLTLVALHHGNPIGMCSLREHDGFRPDCVYNNISEEALSKIACLGSLVVDPAYQKQGVGRMLINATQKKARDLGFQKLYLIAFEPSLYHYYARLGWHKVGTDTFQNHSVIVMDITV